MPPRREPERTCVGCRAKGGRDGLLRVVRLADGDVAVDPAGTTPGRGAWLHRRPDCVRSAVRRGSVARALRTPLGAARAARLMEQLLRAIGDGG